MKLAQNKDTVQLQIDFAENFSFMSQNEIQSGHWNQKLVSLVTIALRYGNQMHSKAFASDNTDHTNNTVIPYLRFPKEIKRVDIWSDGPSAQFKNKFIGATILIFENLSPVKIVWNFFATSHGKGAVYGIGAIVKNKVRRTSIVVTEVNQPELNSIRIGTELELEYVIEAAAEAIPNISTYHQLQVVENWPDS